MKLTLHSADYADYARKWIERNKDMVKKYMVEEKRARVPLMINVERIRLAYQILGKIREFFALETECLPVAGFTEENFRPGKLVSQERGKNLCPSYAKKTSFR